MGGANGKRDLIGVCRAILLVISLSGMILTGGYVAFNPSLLLGEKEEDILSLLPPWRHPYLFLHSNVLLEDKGDSKEEILREISEYDRSDLDAAIRELNTAIDEGDYYDDDRRVDRVPLLYGLYECTRQWDNAVALFDKVLEDENAPEVARYMATEMYDIATSNADQPDYIWFWKDFKSSAKFILQNYVFALVSLFSFLLLAAVVPRRAPSGEDIGADGAGKGASIVVSPLMHAGRLTLIALGTVMFASGLVLHFL